MFVVVLIFNVLTFSAVRRVMAVNDVLYSKTVEPTRAFFLLDGDS